MDALRHLIVRDGTWYYQRRVPRTVAEHDPRRFVRRSTKTADRATAIVIAEKFNRETEAFWNTLLSGVPPADAAESYARAVKRARALGFGYVGAEELTTPQAVDDLAARVLHLVDGRLLRSQPVVESLLGMAEPVTFKLSDLAETFFNAIAEEFLSKSEAQVVRFKIPRVRAVKRLIACVGDMLLTEVTRDHALQFREWWLARVREGNLDFGTANKDIGQINMMLNTVADRYRLDVGKPFQRMRLRGGSTRQRPAFSSAWVQDHILAPGALDGLNTEARVVIYVMCNTGLRPSEIVNLLPDRIHIECDIPFVEIRPDGRQVKTELSIREVPLVGVALDALRQFREPFARYRHKSDSLSAAINKYFDENDLKETPGHTLYSLRHTFQDKLISVEAPERVQAELMGHKISRPRYGNGPSLQQKAQWLAKTSFDAAANVAAR